MALSWHVARTKNFSEMIAEKALRDKGFSSFNPKCYTERFTRGRRVLTERCYIPGYIFIQFDPVEQPNWPSINYTRGIHSLLYMGPEKAAPIRDSAMNIILDRCNGDRVKAEDIDFAISKIIPVGANVKIVDGPFAGFEGPVKWSDGQRIKVLLSLFGRPMQTGFKSKHVELV